MTTSIQQTIDQIKSEFTVDFEGKCHLSNRAAARLLEVSETSVRRTRRTLRRLDCGKLPQQLDFTGVKGATDLYGKDALSDIEFSVIAEHYAFDAGTYCTEAAKLVYRTFAAMGVRVWIQGIVGWQSKQQAESEQKKLSTEIKCRLANRIDGSTYYQYYSEASDALTKGKEFQYRNNLDGTVDLLNRGVKDVGQAEINTALPGDSSQITPS